MKGEKSLEIGLEERIRRNEVDCELNDINVTSDVPKDNIK